MLTPLIPDDSNKLPPQLANLRQPDTGPPGLGSLPPLPDTSPSSAGFGGLKPIVTNPRQQQEQELQSKLMQKPQGFWQNLRHVLGTAATVAGDVVDPGATKLINQGLGRQGVGPAANEYRQKQLEGLQGQDVAEQQAAAKNTLDASQGVEAQARAAEIQEMTKEAPAEAASKEGLENAETAGSTPDIATYRSLVQMGMKPSDALKEVEHDKAMALKPAGGEHVAFQDSKGQQIEGTYDPQTRQFSRPDGTVVPDARPIPPPAAVGAVTMIEPSGKVDRLTPGQTAKPGSVTPGGLSSENVPTAATRTMSETAPKVIDLANRSEQLIDQQISTLGPMASRWNEFMAGKVGAPNPEFTKLRTNIGLLQTALMRMHVGARGGEKIMEHFADLIDSSKQDPQNLKAALEEIKAYADEVGKSGGTGTAAETAKAEGGTGPAVGTVEGGYKFKGGDPSKAENWVKQ